SCSALFFSDCCTTMCLFCNDWAPTDVAPLSLHDALPICGRGERAGGAGGDGGVREAGRGAGGAGCGVRDWRRGGDLGGVGGSGRSEEHTSELQSRENLVCRLLLEKKKNEESTQEERWMGT